MINITTSTSRGFENLSDLRLELKIENLNNMKGKIKIIYMSLKKHVVKRIYLKVEMYNYLSRGWQTDVRPAKYQLFHLELGCYLVMLQKSQQSSLSYSECKFSAQCPEHGGSRPAQDDIQQWTAEPCQSCSNKNQVKDAISINLGPGVRHRPVDWHLQPRPGVHYNPIPFCLISTSLP